MWWKHTKCSRETHQQVPIRALMGAARKCERRVYIIKGYTLKVIRLHFCDFTFKHFMAIMLALFCFIDLLRTGQCCLYHNGPDNKNETTFSLMYNCDYFHHNARLSSTNFTWSILEYTWPHMCCKYGAVPVTSFKFFFVLHGLLWKIVSETELGKRFAKLNWERAV